MNILQTDGFKIGIVVTICLVLVFFLIDIFVMEAFSSIGRLQDRNNALNTKTTAILIKHKRVKFIMHQLQIAEEVKVVSNYITSVAYNIQPDTIKNIAANIVTHSTAVELPVELTVAVIQTLSGFNPTAVGKNNSRGLFQRNTSQLPIGFKGGALRKLHEIEQNIIIGTVGLADCVKMSPNNTIAALVRFLKVDSVDPSIKNITNNLLNYSIFRNNEMKEFRKRMDAPGIIKIATKQLLEEIKTGKGE